MARKCSRTAKLHATSPDPGRRGTLPSGIAEIGKGNDREFRRRHSAWGNFLDEFEKNRPAGKMQRRKTSYRENTPGNTFQSQSCCTPVADQLQGIAEKTPGIRSGRKNSEIVERRKHRNTRVTPLRERAMNAKTNKNLGLNLKKLARILRRGLPQNQIELELSHLAISDELTGLYNRRGFLVLGSERMKLAHGMKKNVLLFFADLDNLKQINDQFGHTEGDQALLKTAEIFRNTFRNSDIIGRFGGDEFTALVIEEYGQTADTICRRLQDNMAELAGNNTQYPLSLSVGMTRYAAEMRSSLKKLLAQADQALYKQKQANHASTR